MFYASLLGLSDCQQSLMSFGWWQHNFYLCLYIQWPSSLCARHCVKSWHIFLWFFFNIDIDQQEDIIKICRIKKELHEPGIEDTSTHTIPKNIIFSNLSTASLPPLCSFQYLRFLLHLSYLAYVVLLRLCAVSFFLCLYIPSEETEQSAGTLSMFPSTCQHLLLCPIYRAWVLDEEICSSQRPVQCWQS